MFDMFLLIIIIIMLCVAMMWPCILPTCKSYGKTRPAQYLRGNSSSWGSWILLETNMDSEVGIYTIHMKSETHPTSRVRPNSLGNL